MKSLQFNIPHLIFLSFVISLTACTDSQDNISDINELTVLTRNAPTTWYKGRDAYAGPEYDLINSFAAYKNINVRFVVMDSIDEILIALENGKGDIAAAGLTKTRVRAERGLHFGPSYHYVEQQVVCRRNTGKIPRKISDLIGKKLMVVSNSSYEELLKQLKSQHPELEWKAQSKFDTEKLLQMVWKKQIDCTIADSNIVSINRRYYPELVVAFVVSKTQELAWVLSDKAKYLSSDIKKWLSIIKSNGELAVIMDRYFGHVEVFDYVDIQKFKRRINSRLPEYRQKFEQAARDHQIPWEMLAAQSYQESHWNPLAKSPTGVRGLMMLTRNTAKSLGVTDRLDPEQSIQGGAKYVRRMLKRIPDTIAKQDRLWFALASYNVGYGHVKDARTLAKRLGKNPDIWVDLKSVLPLLSQKKYYKTLRYGYARGTEPVRYVQRIRNYWEVLDSTL